jgi:uncharacterized protein (TIGR02246 family)
MVSRFGALAIGLAALSSLRPLLAEEQAAPEQAIRAAAREYQAALAKGDAEAVARFWTPDGSFIDEQGRPHPASELAAEATLQARGNEPTKQEGITSTIRLLTPDVALEDGTSAVDLPGGAQSRGHFHAVWVKRDGRWLIASLCEVPIEPSAEVDLAELGWMVGNWSAREGDADLQAAVHWNATGTFLLRDLKVMQNGSVVFRSTLRIGIDPRTGKLASWTFDSDGGLGEATWTKQGNAWIAQSTGVLADGQKTAGTHVISHGGANTLVWKTLGGSVSGQPIEDHEVRFTRQNDAQE